MQAVQEGIQAGPVLAEVLFSGLPDAGLAGEAQEEGRMSEIAKLVVALKAEAHNSSTGLDEVTLNSCSNRLRRALAADVAELRRLETEDHVVGPRLLSLGLNVTAHYLESTE